MQTMPPPHPKKKDLIALVTFVIILFPTLDDVLESFLSEYREKRLHRQQKGASRLTHSTDSRSCPTPTADSASQEWYDPHIQDGKFDTEDSTDNGDDDVCFTTPEDPKGVELVINLLTTWGDKFYIGLTGVELYANSGEPAQVTQVQP